MSPSDWAPRAEPAHATLAKPTPIPGLLSHSREPQTGTPLPVTHPFPSPSLPTPPQHAVLVFHTDAVRSSYT